MIEIKSVGVTYNPDKSVYDCSVRYEDQAGYRCKSYRKPETVPANVKRFMETATKHTARTLHSGLFAEYFE